MTWGDVDKAGGFARSPAAPTPVLYLGDEDEDDNGSAFGDDDVVPPPPPPLPSELSTGRPEPSVPRPPRTEEYFGANGSATTRAAEQQAAPAARARANDDIFRA